MRGATPPLPNAPSWRVAQLKHRYNFLLCVMCHVHFDLVNYILSEDLVLLKCWPRIGSRCGLVTRPVSTPATVRYSTGPLGIHVGRNLGDSIDFSVFFFHYFLCRSLYIGVKCGSCCNVTERTFHSTLRYTAYEIDKTSLNNVNECNVAK
jgi:hypothetical protein